LLLTSQCIRKGQPQTAEGGWPGFTAPQRDNWT